MPECMFSVVNIVAAVISSMALGAMAVLAVQACHRGRRRRRIGTGGENGHADAGSERISNEATAGDGVSSSLHASLLGETQT